MTDRPLRVLIVEDHQDTREYLMLYLQQSGHAVLCAGTIRQALETIGTSECDVILSDISLSDGTGWDLLSELEASRSIYAIAMSGFGTAADSNRSKSVGFRHHLVKPVNPDRLDQLLEEARREKRHASAAAEAERR